MHMADALLSPAVGGGFWLATAGTIACCSRWVRQRLDDRQVPLMGVLGAFIFAAQMINFTIPGTGSSGHLGGGLLLAILLGPSGAFLVMASVLTVQALFFADGGLLALGCNIFNLGFLPCFIAYPLIFRPLAGKCPAPGRVALASVPAAIVALQLGALGVVLETLVSGISAFPFKTFALLMQSIHLAIGLVEGVVTAAVVGYVGRVRPEIFLVDRRGGVLAGLPIRKVLVTLAAAAILTGGGLSWFASDRLDGLEWAIDQASRKSDLAAPQEGRQGMPAGVQEEKTALQPDDRSFAPGGGQTAVDRSWPGVQVDTSIAGLVGGILTLVLIAGVGLLLRWRRPREVPS